MLSIANSVLIIANVFRLISLADSLGSYIVCVRKSVSWLGSSTKTAKQPLRQIPWLFISYYELLIVSLERLDRFSQMFAGKYFLCVMFLFDQFFCTWNISCFLFSRFSQHCFELWRRLYFHSSLSCLRKAQIFYFFVHLCGLVKWKNSRIPFSFYPSSCSVMHWILNGPYRRGNNLLYLSALLSMGIVYSGFGSVYIIFRYWTWAMTKGFGQNRVHIAAGCPVDYWKAWMKYRPICSGSVCLGSLVSSLIADHSFKDWSQLRRRRWNWWPILRSIWLTVVTVNQQLYIYDWATLVFRDAQCKSRDNRPI